MDYENIKPELKDFESTYLLSQPIVEKQKNQELKQML